MKLAVIVGELDRLQNPVLVASLVVPDEQSRRRDPSRTPFSSSARANSRIERVFDLLQRDDRPASDFGVAVLTQFDEARRRTVGAARFENTRSKLAMTVGSRAAQRCCEDQLQIGIVGVHPPSTEEDRSDGSFDSAASKDLARR